eukprot:s3264_g4.t1
MQSCLEAAGLSQYKDTLSLSKCVGYHILMFLLCLLFRAFSDPFCLGGEDVFLREGFDDVEVLRKRAQLDGNALAKEPSEDLHMPKGNARRFVWHLEGLGGRSLLNRVRLHSTHLKPQLVDHFLQQFFISWMIASREFGRLPEIFLSAASRRDVLAEASAASLVDGVPEFFAERRQEQLWKSTVEALECRATWGPPRSGPEPRQAYLALYGIFSELFQVDEVRWVVRYRPGHSITPLDQQMLRDWARSCSRCLRLKAMAEKLLKNSSLTSQALGGVLKERPAGCI